MVEKEKRKENATKKEEENASNSERENWVEKEKKTPKNSVFTDVSVILLRLICFPN